MAELDAIVCNFKTPGDLRSFLKSFRPARNEVGCTLTIVNVQPDPEDGLVSVEELWPGAQTEASIVSWSDNLGFNRACNAAAATSREVPAPYLALFNADVILRPGALAHCVQALKDHPDWAVVGPRQVNESNQITSAGTFGTVTKPEMRGWHEIDRGQFNDVRDDAVHVSGAAMFWRRSIWDELTACPQFQEAAPGATGALLSTCHHFYGETFAMAHALSHGFKVVFDGSAPTIVHKWHRASRVGGEVELRMPEEKAEFERACRIHGINVD